MSGMWGADVTELRRLARSLQSASDQLVSTTSEVSGLVEAAGRWQGGDADQFRSEWTGTSVALLRGVSQTLSQASEAVLRNADEQFMTSTEGGSIPSPGVPGPGVPTGPGGGPLGRDDPLDGSIWDVGETAWGAISFGLAGWKTWKVGQSLTAFLQASRLADLSDAAASASVFARGMVLDDAMGLLGGLGTAGRIAGGVGGLFGVIGGVNQMFNTQYDGWRGGVDRVMGGLSVVGGAGTMLMMAGMLTNPVGIGVVVGAGVVAGAWALGNLVVDNWDSITGFVSNPGPYLADGWGHVTDFASSAADTIGNAVSDVGDAIGDGLSAAGDFIGGLFS
ncbi:WXG100 family type VII secretion target [Cellulosimicrobium composti]|uniref:WXG100 family type VII secretion target n=1 Tax=Cellulosimicrobium composti TaxID=2672572 RepID=A0A6N7ZGA6_9MICO|nr:hypothetical protein [Cellulosimicrobium composti]MTG88290.1 hypothetical protein [Cellulosimicrobium composti]